MVGTFHRSSVPEIVHSIAHPRNPEIDLLVDTTCRREHPSVKNGTSYLLPVVVVCMMSTGRRRRSLGEGFLVSEKPQVKDTVMLSLEFDAMCKVCFKGKKRFMSAAVMRNSTTLNNRTSLD